MQDLLNIKKKIDRKKELEEFIQRKWGNGKDKDVSSFYADFDGYMVYKYTGRLSGILCKNVERFKQVTFDVKFRFYNTKGLFIGQGGLDDLPSDCYMVFLNDNKKSISDYVELKD